MISREILYKKMEILIDDLLKENPPFDKPSQNKTLLNFYGDYMNYYSALDVGKRKNIIKAQNCHAKWAIHNHIFGYNKNTPYPYPELSKIITDFRIWIQERKVSNLGDVATTEKFDILNILEERMSAHFPQFHLNKAIKIPGFYIFSFNIFKDIDLIIGFDRTTSGGALDIYIGLNIPRMLVNISHFYGSGCCCFFYNTKQEFVRGLDLAFEVLDFFYPKFHKAITEAYEE